MKWRRQLTVAGFANRPQAYFKSLPQCKQDLFAVVSKCPTHPGTLKILKQLTGFPRGIHIPNSVLLFYLSSKSLSKEEWFIIIYLLKIIIIHITSIF